MASKQNWDALNEAIRRSANRHVVPMGAGADAGNAGVSPYDIPDGPLWNPDTFQTSVEERPDEPGFLDRFFDIISRPAYALNNVIKDTYDHDPNTDNPLESIVAGLSGIDKTRGADISKQRRAQAGDYSDNDNDFGVGLAWDLFTDPLNFIPMGWAGKLASRGYQGVTKGKAAVKEVGDAVIPAETSAADAIARQSQPPPGAAPAPTPSPGPGPTGGGGGGTPMPGAAPTPAGAPGSMGAATAYLAGRSRRANQAGPTPPLPLHLHLTSTPSHLRKERLPL